MPPGREMHRDLERQAAALPDVLTVPCAFGDGALLHLAQAVLEARPVVLRGLHQSGRQVAHMLFVAMADSRRS